MKTGTPWLFAAALVACAVSARAESVTPRPITGGQVVSSPSTGQFNVTGDGFDLSGLFDVFEISCQPCAGGQSISITLLPEIRTLSGTVDGVTYSNLFLGGVIGDASTFNLTSTTPVVIPTDPTSTAVNFGFQSVAGAELIGYSDSTRTQRVVDVPLTGSGTATLALHTDFLNSNGLPVFSESSITWLFGQQPAPTPEPATLVLLSTGTALVAWKAKRRRRGANDEAPSDVL
jgi:hypothetical protein